MRVWSEYQENIFSFVEKATGNAIIEAVAGSGKSTTIVECMNRIPKSLSPIFLAFNKSVATELKERGVNARTFHSLTYTPVLKAIGVSAVDINKLYNLCNMYFSKDENIMYGTFIRKLVSLAKQVGIGCLHKDEVAAWNLIIDHHNLELENEKANVETAIAMAQDLLKFNNEAEVVDFDDLLYFPILKNISLPKFDFIFVDEAQDTNAVQREILKRIMKKGARIIAVGDPAQAIYGFRGADSNSMKRIAEIFNCISLPLTVSYRCPTTVVEHARKWVSHIEAAPNAPVGEVVNLDMKWDMKMFKPADLIVSRVTRPLVSLAYSMFAAKIPCYIMGRDIGEGLKKIIEKMKAKGIDNLLEKLSKWEEREIKKAQEKNLEAKAADIQDKVATIKTLIDAMPETERTVPALLTTLDILFQDKSHAVVLATIHKAKGLEADNVYWLNHDYVNRWAKKEWMLVQESNLCYVATTRAKKKLALIRLVK